MIQKRVLFVCLGNICRSPLAEGIFRHKIDAVGLSDQIGADSAGTSGWHEGDLPDPRSIAVARQYGVDLTVQRSRPFRQADFYDFDLILGMDSKNVTTLAGLKPSDATGHVALFMDYAEGRDEPVPDPYYGGDDGFEKVYRQLDGAMEALIARLTTA
ncbi:low molecular weight protein-tyrosine-phosphatase [Coralliovum pocilloporae]|uniref:low molecular weight protein-tyrosine-phosphatase n=1 Tax=Coralliovum pocilloporae TaxID=3066369 RepID=UPI0033073312